MNPSPSLETGTPPPAPQRELRTFRVRLTNLDEPRNAEEHLAVGRDADDAKARVEAELEEREEIEFSYLGFDVEVIGEASSSVEPGCPDCPHGPSPVAS